MMIDRSLSLVIPLERDAGDLLYVHSTPISSQVYDSYWRVLARTFSDINMQGLGAMGPRIAAKMLRDVAEEMGVWSDDPRAKRIGVERGLIAEIRRLTNALVPGEKGWELIPIDDAVKSGHVDEEDLEEVDGILVFFTAGSHLFRKATRTELLTGALAPWGARIESLSCTEFLKSLTTSTAGESTGVSAVA